MNITHKNREFTVAIEPDEDMAHPWEEHGGIWGEVRESRTHHSAQSGVKRPGERPLNCPDRFQFQYFYDVQASTALALRAGAQPSSTALAAYVAKHGKAPTARQVAAMAAEQDFQFLRKYLAGDAGWFWVRVTDDETGESESVGGILCEHDDRYLKEVARNLASGLCLQREERERDLNLAYAGM